MRVNLIFLLVAMTVAAGPFAHAADKDILRDACSAVKDGKKRAQCFDALDRVFNSKAQVPEKVPFAEGIILGQEADIARLRLIQAAQKLLTNRMKDPDSVRFRNVLTSPKLGATCGEINAKNSAGGYVGFKRFIVADDQVGIEDDGTSFVEANWFGRCRDDIKY